MDNTQPPTPTATLTATMARHVAGARFEDLPATAVHAARRALLDALGVMQAASGLTAEVLPFIELARQQGGRPEATILGTRDRVPAPLAAFANGAMAHALDFEDAFDRAPLHPNASGIPAMLALGEARAPTSARELLTAIAVGCDLACRLALSLRARMEDGGWYPPPILGAFGAVAGAARMLRLNPVQIADSFSLMLLQISTPGEIKHSDSTVLRAVREAFPAQAAVTAALLAERGMQGFSAPFEGQAGFYRLFAASRFEPQDICATLGEYWYVEALSFKPWPCCRGTHAAVELALNLRAEHSLRAADIAAVTIEGGPLQSMLALPASRKCAPRTAIDAKFSLPFSVACAFTRGAVDLECFAPAALQDVAVLELASRCSFRQRDDWGADGTSGALELFLQDGRRLRAELRRPLGSPDRPLDDAALVRKYVDCARRAATPVEPVAARALALRILALDQEPDIAFLTR